MKKAPLYIVTIASLVTSASVIVTTHALRQARDEQAALDSARPAVRAATGCRLICEHPSSGSPIVYAPSSASCPRNHRLIGWEGDCG